MHPNGDAGFFPPTVADYPFKGGTKIFPWVAPEKYMFDKGSSYPKFRGENSKENMKTLKPPPSP